jgi:hypothetical protein
VKSSKMKKNSRQTIVDEEILSVSSLRGCLESYVNRLPRALLSWQSPVGIVRWMRICSELRWLVLACRVTTTMMMMNDTTAIRLAGTKRESGV